MKKTTCDGSIAPTMRFLAILSLLFTVLSQISHAECLADRVITGVTGDWLGLQVEVAGDVNADGVDDLIVRSSNRVFVFSGSNTDTIYSLTNPLPFPVNFGLLVSRSGDVNNDGFADFIIGSGGISHPPFMLRDPPIALLYSGATGELLRAFPAPLTHSPSSTLLPLSAAGAGDVNNDGFDDVIIGFPRDGVAGSQFGSAIVFSGQTGDTLYHFLGEGNTPILDRFGSAVAGAGDVNSDGFDDVIIGAVDNSAGGFLAGRVYVFSGFDGTKLFTFTGYQARMHLGLTISGGSDVTGDSMPDFLIGGNDQSFVFSGKDGAALLTFSGQTGLKAVGDVTGDGVSEMLLGDVFYNSSTGRALLLSGIDGSTLAVYNGESADDFFGASLSGKGDFNNDGLADIVIGARDNDFGGPSAGRVYIHYGNPTTYLCGDINNDCVTDKDDVAFLVDFYFHGGPVPPVLLSADVDCDGLISIADIVYLLNFLAGSIPNLCCSNTNLLPDRWIQYESKTSGK